jgi:calcineurin-like phosphoesterase family protein
MKINNRRYWFISDIHADHTNVIRLSNRPFKNINEMVDTVVTNINKVVQPNDVLIFVGDICLGKKEAWISFLSRITNKNWVLVRGNHDSWQAIPKELFMLVVEQFTIRLFGKIFIVSHYPYRCSVWRAFIKRLHPAVLSPKRPKDNGLWLLHGHDHRLTRFVDYHPRMLSVGCDANNFKPISGEEVVRLVQRQESKLKEERASKCWVSVFERILRKSRR